MYFMLCSFMRFSEKGPVVFTRHSRWSMAQKKS